MEEIWKDIPFATNYLCSNLGNVKSKRFGIPLKGYLNKSGYMRVQLGNCRNKHYVHRLVAQTFLPNKDGNNIVNHIDGNKLNNRVENLEWCTCSENDNHAYKMGLRQPTKGEKHGSHKLTAIQVEDIRIFLGQNVSIAEISRKYGVAKKTIRDIRSRKTWN